MPIYEYECQTCGTTFEKRKSFKEESRSDCPNGHPEARRLLSTPAIVFKGSGFYINDSKSKKSSTNGSSTKNNSNGSSDKSKSSSNGDSKESSTASPKSETSTDKKSDPKPKPVSTE